MQAGDLTRSVLNRSSLRARSLDKSLKPLEPEADQNLNTCEAEEVTVVTDSAWRRFCKHRLAAVALGVVSIQISFLCLYPVFCPQNYQEVDWSYANQVPCFKHWLGRDRVGRDFLLYLSQATRTSFALAATGSFIGTSIATVVGVYAGMKGGMVDILLQRWGELIDSIDGYFLIITLMHVCGLSIVPAMLVYSGVYWAHDARQLRSWTLSLRQKDYVEASRLNGVGNWGITKLHIFPHLSNIIFIQFVSRLQVMLARELYFHSLGMAMPTNPMTLGTLMEYRPNLTPNYEIIGFTPIFVFLSATLCLLYVGEGLREALDPKG